MAVARSSVLLPMHRLGVLDSRAAACGEMLVTAATLRAVKKRV